MKLFYDYFPIICFFVAYKFYGIFTATAVTMVASLLQISIFWLITKRFEKIHWITLCFVLVLGGATLIFHEAIFIQWKPSVVYWLLGIILIFSQFVGKRPIIHRLLSDKITLPERIWGHVNLSWGVFFIFLGFLNIYIVYHYSTNAWVNFKLFGVLGLTLSFTFIQFIFLARYLSHPKGNK